MKEHERLTRSEQVQPMSEENMATLAGALDRLQDSRSERTLEDLIPLPMPARNPDDLLSGPVREEVPAADDRWRAFARSYRDGRIQLVAAGDVLTQRRAMHENAIADSNLVYPADHMETVFPRVRTAEGESFIDIEQDAIDKYNAIIFQNNDNMDAIEEQYGVAPSRMSGFTSTGFSSQIRDGNTQTESNMARALRLRSVDPDGIRRWNRTVMAQNNVDDPNNANGSIPSSGQPMGAPLDSRAYDYYEKAMTERDQRIKRNHVDRMDAQRIASAREQTLIQQAIAGETYSFEEIELQRREIPAALFENLHRIADKTYTATQKAWIAAV